MRALVELRRCKMRMFIALFLLSQKECLGIAYEILLAMLRSDIKVCLFFSYPFIIHLYLHVTLSSMSFPI